MKNENGFPASLERFFTHRLIAQRRVSSHTIASYRDTFRLLLQFVEKRLHKPPSGLALTDLDTSLIGAFLDELEKDRGNGARSRNLRLTLGISFQGESGQSVNLLIGSCLLTFDGSHRAPPATFAAVLVQNG